MGIDTYWTHQVEEATAVLYDKDEIKLARTIPRIGFDNMEDPKRLAIEEKCIVWSRKGAIAKITF